jgi:hypothetical protein
MADVGWRAWEPKVIFIININLQEGETKTTVPEKRE